MSPIAYDLLAAVTALAEILDQPIEKNGIIRVQYQFASEIIHAAQLAARTAAQEITGLVDDTTHLSGEMEVLSRKIEELSGNKHVA